MDLMPKGTDIIECGVGEGTSAYLFAKVAYLRKLNYFAFDTFEGLPELEKKSLNDEPKAGWLSNTSKKEVEKFVLKSGVNVNKLNLIEGYFPESASTLDEREFSLIHLDTDLYKSTFDALDYFYPKIF